MPTSARGPSVGWERRPEVSKYPYFGVPPTRKPRPAVDEPALTGKRVILSTAGGLRLRHAGRRRGAHGRRRRCGHRHPQRGATTTRFGSRGAMPIRSPGRLTSSGSTEDRLLAKSARSSRESGLTLAPEGLRVLEGVRLRSRCSTNLGYLGHSVASGPQPDLPILRHRGIGQGDSRVVGLRRPPHREDSAVAALLLGVTRDANCFGARWGHVDRGEPSIRYPAQGAWRCLGQAWAEAIAE